MGVIDLRKSLEDIRASARAGDLKQVVETVERALDALDGSRLLTTTEAAHLLGVRSVNTLKLLVRQSQIPYEVHGNRMMIPLAALEGLRHSTMVCGIQASDAAHDAIAALGPDSGLSDQELRDLAATRPGQLPWHTAVSAS